MVAFKQKKLDELDSKFKMVFVLPNNGVNGIGERRVQAHIPDGLGYTLSNNYTTPFDVGALGGLLQKGNALAGKVNGGRTLSAAPGIGMDKVFTNPEPTEISFDLEFAAYYSALEEVVYPALTLTMMTAAHSITWGDAKQTLQAIKNGATGIINQIEDRFSAPRRTPNNPSLSPDGVTPPPRYAKMIAESAKRNNVPPEYLAALAMKESTYNENAVNPTELPARHGGGHAKGLYQYTPRTARQHGINPEDPEQSTEQAAKDLRKAYEKFGNWNDASAAHFGGLGVNQNSSEVIDYKSDVGRRASLIKQAWDPSESLDAPYVFPDDYRREINEANNKPGNSGDSSGRYVVDVDTPTPEGVMSLINFMRGPGRVHITVGDFYEMPDVFISSLSVEFSNKLDHDGLPLSAKCSLTIVPEKVLTDRVLTRDWFPSFDLMEGSE